MLSETTITATRQRVRAWRSAGERIAFVPTMGNLHPGHLALVDHAASLADKVVVSIFVNPLQFGEGEDFGAYPRTLQADTALLQERRCDLLFAPSEAEMYPRGRQGLAFVEVPGLSDILCGASRPGHFRGVATVVSKLFNIVEPDVAVFGQKDYQQLAVLRRMAADLCFPVELAGLPTVREADGLAMSSRNSYLTPEERKQAPALYEALRRITEALREGRRDFAALEAGACDELARSGMAPDYVSIRQADSLDLPQSGDRSLVVLGAARLGKTRLIDNLLIDL